MKLSIIVPCYKVEQYLNQCIESIVCTDSNDFEIILVDDGSPDRVPEMCDNWALKDRRISVIHKENSGLSEARNTGFDAAKGEYIWFIDSDDWITNDAVYIVLRLIEEHSDIDVFVTPLQWSWDDVRKNYIDIVIDKNTYIIGKNYLRKYQIGASPRNIIKRNLLIEHNIRFVPNILHEDELYGYMLYYTATKVMVLKDFLYHYRQREESIMHTVNIKRAYSFISIHKELMKFMDEHIPEDETKDFRLLALNILTRCIPTALPLRGSKDYSDFLITFKDYRIPECKKCLPTGYKSRDFDIKLFSTSPILYYFFHNWKTIIKNKLKSFVKLILTKAGLFSSLYDIWKGKSYEINTCRQYSSRESV